MEKMMDALDDTQTMDDLRYELKCMTQKCEILQRNYKILVDERAIQQGPADGGTAGLMQLERELATKNAGV
jgi:hypothetical protein